MSDGGPSRVLGLDIGGTSSRARVAGGPGLADVIADSTAPSASLTAAGLAAASESLDQLLAGVGLAGVVGSHAKVDAVCAGSAGSGAPGAVGWLTDRFAPLTHSGRAESVLVVNDSLLALPAAGLDEGIAVICGTGSTAVGRRGEQVERAGGWGYMLGDEGSGYWIAREAVREIARRHDEHEPIGRLGATLIDDTGMTDVLSLIQEWHAVPSPATWADLAPLVLDCDDPHAATILTKAAQALADLAVAVERRLGWPAGMWVPVVLAGGLVTRQARLQSAVMSRIAEEIPAATVTVAEDPPVAGAVRLAWALAQAGRHEASGRSTDGRGSTPTADGRR